MTSFEFSLGATERFVDAAAAVCEEAKRLGAQFTMVALLYEEGPIALIVDNAPDIDDDHRRFGVSPQHWEANPIFRVMRDHLAPCGPETLDPAEFVPLARAHGYKGAAQYPFVAPLVGSRGWFGVMICGTLGPLSKQFERDFAMLATHLSVWCSLHGIGAVPKRPQQDRLGPRQRQVADLAARGFTNEEIGDELGISVNTVKSRLKEVFDVLEVRNRTELVHVLRLLAPPEEVRRGVTRVGAVTVTRAG
jgi:DNA-binding CsgD family transcriptional regulator